MNIDDNTNNYDLGRAAHRELQEKVGEVNDLHMLGVILNTVGEAMILLRGSGRGPNDPEVIEAGTMTLDYVKGLLAEHLDYEVAKGAGEIPDTVPEGWL